MYSFYIFRTQLECSDQRNIQGQEYEKERENFENKNKIDEYEIFSKTKKM